MIEQICCFFIFFGGFMSYTIALGLILEKDKKTYQYVFAALMFCLGVLQISDGLIFEQRADVYSALLFWHLPFLAWIGPLFFFSFKSANNDFFRLRPVDYLHFSCGIVIIPFLMPLVTMDTATKVSFIMTPPKFTGVNAMFRLYSGLLIVVIVNIIGYLVYFMRECFFMLDIRLIRERKVSPYLMMVMFICFPFQIVFFMSIFAINLVEGAHSYYFPIIHSLTVGSFFLTLVVFIMEKRNINFFKVLHDQLENRRYEISKIKNVDVARVLSQIKYLMEDKKIFFDEELTVNGLARELAIEPYQLSQIINETFNKNFNYFVNEYRIKEAQKILLAEADRTIISVAYAVGFNSTTVFYEWFSRITGDTPKKYVKKMNGVCQPGV